MRAQRRVMALLILAQAAEMDARRDMADAALAGLFTPACLILLWLDDARLAGAGGRLARAAATLLLSRFRAALPHDIFRDKKADNSRRTSSSFRAPRDESRS